ncbi:uncharacterized protein LOC132692318 isoform X2 [Panthera onca]
MFMEDLLFAKHCARHWRYNPDTSRHDFCLHRIYSLMRKRKNNNNNSLIFRSPAREPRTVKGKHYSSPTSESAIFQGAVELRDTNFGVIGLCMELKAVRMRSPKELLTCHPD